MNDIDKNADGGQEKEIEVITIIDEDTAEEVELYVLEKLTYKDNLYYLLTETEIDERNPEDDSDVVIFKEVKNESGEAAIEEIEDDDEFDAVAALFEEQRGEEFKFIG